MSKHEKFIDLANQRVNKAIKMIRLIGNLSNKQNYEYSKEEVDKVIKALQAELDEAKTRFKLEIEQSPPDFKL